jgi:methyltransferase (TIGR00027 family)
MTVTVKTKGLRQGLGKVWAWLVGDGYTRSPLTGRAALDWVPHGGPAVEGSATDGASRTAIMTAQFRAAHALMDRDPIFEDRFALALADRSAADVMAFLAASIPHSCAHVVRLFVGQRSRFAEEEVARAVASGVDQYVDLGAGLNSFAWRRPDLMARLALFEVDLPATQAWKRGRLTATGLACPPNLHFVGVDLRTAETLGPRLTASGFDPTRASIWSWLGVIPYLPLGAVQSTLAAVAGLAAPGSRLGASYGVPEELMDPASVEFTNLTRAFTARIGEPQITWVAPPDMERVARAAGWPRVRSVDPSSFAPWFAGRTDGLKPVRAEWLLLAEMGTP